jgi:arylsulfatase A-like enzyme
VQNLDYAQTFLEIANVDAPKNMQGRSLVPLLKSETPEDWRESVYYHYFEYPGPHMVPKHCGVRTKNLKLIHFYEFDEWEFYDLNSDPDESNNLYNDPKYADQIAAMKIELDRLKQNYDDDSDFSEKPEAWQKEKRTAR